MLNPLGSIFSAGGDLMEADDKSKAYQNQADDYSKNAAYTRAAGQYNVMRLNIAAGRKFGAISSDYAASGVSADSGSALDVLAASHTNAEYDRLNILHQSEMRAQVMDERATYDRQESGTVTQMGYFNAFGSLFQGGASYGMNSTASDEDAGDPTMSTKSGGNTSGMDEGGYGDFS